MVGRKVIEKEAKIQRAELDSEAESEEYRIRTKPRRKSSLKACCAPPENVFNYTKLGKDQCDERDLYS